MRASLCATKESDDKFGRRKLEKHTMATCLYTGEPSGQPHLQQRSRAGDRAVVVSSLAVTYLVVLLVSPRPRDPSEHCSVPG